MKVLFNTYPLAFFPPGGGEMQLLSYQENLSSFGVTVDLFDQWRPNLKKYDFIHFFSCMPGSLFFMRSVRKAGVPLIVSPNLWVTQETKGDYPFLEIQAQLLCADRVICNSDIECAELSQVFGVDRSKFATVYNGVSDFFIEESSGSLFRSKFSIDYQYVLNVANVEKRKNQLGFIRALKKFPELRLINIGYVRDSEYLEQCKLEGGSQFIHLGALDHRSPELRSAYAGCLFFALPSALETPGLAALEAAGVGAKVLITSVGSTQEYFKDYPVYVNPNSLDSMIAGISNILSMKNSISLRNYVREKFRWPVVITGLLNIYKNSRVVLNSKISMLNFYLEELDGNEWFAWSKAIASLKFPKGYLSFEWRAVESAIVDIWLNGTLIEEGVILGQSWTPFFIDASQGEDTQIIEFRVARLAPHQGNDPRDLGFAVKNIGLKD
jgi:glycosyltransferase involved in cell wall biosynthesis